MVRFDEEVQRVKDHIRGSITRAELLEGTAIYEDVLRSETGASTRATKQALMELAREGLIWRKRHAGTRVADRLPTLSCAALPQIRTLALFSSATQQSFAADYYIQAVLKGIRKALHPAAHITEILNTEAGSLDDVPHVEYDELKRTVQGVISLEATNTLALNRLVQAGLPTVSVDFHPADGVFDAVCVDHIDAGYLLTKRLQEMGHERIAYVGEQQSQGSTDPAWQERLTGYFRAMAMKCGAQPSALVLDVQRHPKKVEELLPEFHRAHKPTAYVLGSAVLAVAAIRALRGLGLSIPREVSLACADNAMSVAENVKLTRTYVSYEELGQQAVRLLSSRVACRPMPPVRCVLQGKFNPGESATYFYRVPGA